MRDALAAAKLATSLAEWGRKKKEPVALLLAARIVADSPIRPLEDVAPAGAQKKLKREGGPSPLSPRLLREEAAALAGEDKDKLMTTLTERDGFGAAPPPSEGRAEAAIGRAGAETTANCHVGTLRAGQLLKYSFSFTESQPAMVSVTAADGSPLSCSVRDASLSLIDETELGADCLIAWTPTASGRFEVQIQHKGSEGTSYTLCIN
jgi:hypothetical protein